jgi:hypothetical protein
MAFRGGVLAGCLALTLTLTFAPVAMAQTASDRETARALMDEAFARREKGDHRGALERYEAADALMHVPTTGLEAARERIALGMLIEARELLSTIVRYPTKPGEPAPFGEARMQAQKLDDELGARIPQLRIVLRGDNGPATVTVDGADVPAATLIAPRRVNPGSHTVVARAGGRERREQVTVRERETKEILFDLSIGTSPATAPPPSSPTTATATAPTPQPSDKTRDADTTGGGSSTPRILMWSGIAVASVGALVGAVTGVMSLAAVSSAKSGCTDGNLCPPPTHDDIASARSLGNVSTASFVIAVGGVALAVTGYVLGRSATRSAAESTALSLSPYVGVGGGGVRGVF